MSVRNIRKLYGNTALPPPEGNSDEEYEPLYARGSPSKYKYQGLVLSSHSESEHESIDAVGVENTPPKEMNKKKKKKKKKQRKSQPIPGTSSKEMDEIDKSIMEVNAILGLPAAPAPHTSNEQTKNDTVIDILAVQHKHLNVANELKKMFGPEAVEPGNKRRGRQPNLNRLLKKSVIVPVADNAMNFQKIGLSMSIERRENGYTYFTFDHNKDYQRIHQTFLRSANYRTNDVIMPMDDDQRNLHIEGMLESADSLFRLEEYTAANTLVEQSIAYMQYVAHPYFNLTNSGTRLEYKYMENRPFHIALLKYMHLLTNRACHRTALELAKLLLNLDPSDPLAVIFIIDTLALRAREHQWLIDAVDYWSKERDAEYLFNLQYSYAMAHFHVATKNKGDLSKADKLLQNVILWFPTVLVKILECASMSLSERLQSHALFNLGEETTSKYLKDLIFLYAKFTWPKWREPAVFDWLTKNANELADKYDKDAGMQELAKELGNKRLNLFQGWPVQIDRHLTIIKPMANLLVDGAVPRVNRARSCDPVPPTENVNRYSYNLAANVSPGGRNSALYELFSSIYGPNYTHGLPYDEDNVVYNNREAFIREVLEERQNNVEIEPEAEEEAWDGTITGDDTLTEEDIQTENELPAAGGSGEPENLVDSVGALTNAVRRFMDVYETGHDPEGPEQNEQRQDQNRQN